MQSLHTCMNCTTALLPDALQLLPDQPASHVQLPVTGLQVPCPLQVTPKQRFGQPVASLYVRLVVLHVQVLPAGAFEAGAGLSIHDTGPPVALQGKLAHASISAGSTSTEGTCICDAWHKLTAAADCCCTQLWVCHVPVAPLIRGGPTVSSRLGTSPQQVCMQ